MDTQGSTRPPWTLLSNHGHVLVAVYLEPNARIAEIAARVGITPRGAQLILRDLVDAGLVERWREGRRNSYSVPAGRLRHPAESYVDLAQFLAVFTPPAVRGAQRRRAGASAAPTSA